MFQDVPVINSFELIRDIYKIDRKTYKNNLDELKKRSSKRKTLVVEYTGSEPEIPDNMTPVEKKNGRLVITLDPEALPVSDAITYLAARTELTDVSVSGISPGYRFSRSGTVSDDAAT